MQDFAAELRAAREPQSYDGDGMVATGERAGGFESYLVQSAAQRGFELGHEFGERAASERFRVQLEDVRETARLAGFDTGASVVLLHTLLGLQEIMGELESRRAHKVMLERARGKLGELVVALESAATVMPTVHPEQIGMDASGMVG